MSTQKPPRARTPRPTTDTPTAALERTPAVRLTRRELLAAAAATGAVGAAGAVLAGCGGTSTVRKVLPEAGLFVMPRTATLFADGTVPRALAQAVTRLLPYAYGMKGVSSVTKNTPAADLVLTFGDLPAGYVGAAIGTSALAALMHLRVPIDAVTGDQARKMLSGAITNWQQVGAPYTLPVKVFTLAGLPTPTGLTLASGAQSVATADALFGKIIGQPGSLALAPVELAGWAMRNLGIDGIYPAQGRGDQTQYLFAPLTLKLGVAQALALQGLNPRALASWLAPVAASATATLDMVVSGDIILGRGVNVKMVEYNDYTYPYHKVRDEFMSADYRVANLECTITDLVPIPTDPSTFTFITASKAVDGLVYAGIQAVTVANNHADNGGPDAFMDMIGNLNRHNIAVYGGGANDAQARAPYVHTVKGMRIAMLGYNNIPPGGPYAGPDSPGIAYIDTDTLPQDIAAARARADIVIPYFHWGIEYTKDPTQLQQQISHLAIDSGADMVLGSHPHWVQAMETYKGKLIVYALANFIFDQDWSEATLEGFMIHLYWRGTTLAGIRFVPTLIVDRCQPNIMTPAQAVNVFNRMWSGSDMLASGQYGPEYEP